MSKTNKIEKIAKEYKANQEAKPNFGDPSTFSKDDTGKARVELIESDFVLGIGKVLTYGASEYGAHNWKLGNSPEDIERIKGALYRHFLKYQGGEITDPDTGLSHLYAIGCNAMFLDYFDRQQNQKLDVTT